MENSLEVVCDKILENTYLDSQKENVNQDIELIKSGNYISKVDKYFNCFYTNNVNILDYIQDEYIIYLDEIGKIDIRAKNIYNDYKDRISYQAFQQILWGRYYSELPIYKKKEKKWINI